MIKKGIKSGEKAEEERLKGWRELSRPGDLKSRGVGRLSGDKWHSK